MKMTYHSGPMESLPQFLEGYLYGLGEVCHTLFGSDGASDLS